MALNDVACPRFAPCFWALTWVPCSLAILELPAPEGAGATAILKHIGYIIRFLWNATRGHRLAPWRSPYLRWRIETYTGIKMQSIGFLEFFGFALRERRELVRFLTWTGEMERYARVKPKNP